MGIWEFISSTAESVKRNAPDATPLKIACTNSYTYGSAALTKLDQAVRIDGVYKLGRWIPDDETKSKIGLYTSKFAQNAGVYALQEGYKLIPGGVAFSKIISKTIHDVEYENLAAEKLKLSEEKKDTPWKHSSGGGGRRLIDGAEMHSRCGVEYSASKVLAKDKTLEDVIQTFMMKEFFGTRFFDDLMVHESARGRLKKNAADN